MKVSTKGRYALRMMVDIAMYDSGEYISLRDVSVRQKISMKYLEQIVGQLTKAGLLRSVRGPQGGYRLARKAEEYTVEEILRVTEGSLVPVACLEDPTNSCAQHGACSTRRLWVGLYKTIQEYLSGITLKDLVQEAQENVGWEYCI